MYRKTRRHQKGGDFVGRGTYGCGFFPGLKCSNDAKRQSQIFTKLLYSEEAKKELDLSEDIKKIDPEMKYSIYPYKLCYPAEDDVFQYMKEGLAKCSISDIPLDNPLIVKELIKHKGLALLQQKYGGKSLNYMMNYVADNKVTANFVYTIFYKFANIFKGLELYHENCFVHLDVKPDNIVLSDKCYLIDFGLSVPLKTYKPGNPRFDAQSPFFIKKHFDYYSFDSNYIKRWNSLFNGDGSMLLNKDAILNYWHTLRNKEYLPQQFYMGEFIDEQFILFSSLLEFIELYKDIFNNLLQLNEGNKTMLKPTLRNHLLKQVDVYSLGFTLSKLTYYLTNKKIDIHGNIVKANDKRHVPAISNEIIKDLYSLSMKMIHISPLKRLTSAAAYLEYKKILKKMPIEKTAATEKILDQIENSPLGLDPYLLSEVLSI